jgi:hypothetical protein
MANCRTMASIAPTLSLLSALTGVRVGTTLAIALQQEMSYMICMAYR